MGVFRLIRAVVRLTVNPWRRRRYTETGLRQRPEFPQVNTLAGVEPVRPELTGLRIRYPAGAPPHLLRRLVDLAYRWYPSEDYRRRQAESRLVNKWLRFRRDEPAVPPILSYVEETDLTPVRLQPFLDGVAPGGEIHELQDLTDLEEAAYRTSPWVIRPRLPEPDGAYLTDYRPLLPRQYREFLRTSPYPRAVAAALAAVVAVGSFLWISQSQQAAAVAAGRAHIARTALYSALDAARVYGVDPRALQPFVRQAQAVDTLEAPSGLEIGRAREVFYREQARQYASLVAHLKRLEHRALSYWTQRAAAAYAALVQATDDATAAGFRTGLPPLPGCSTPVCYRSAAGAGRQRAGWLEETAATLRTYAGQIASAADPAAAAEQRVGEVQTLAGILPRGQMPVAPTNLESREATATTGTQYARVGALAHLDSDALATELVRTLPQRAVVVSTEEQKLWCYQAGRSVFETPVTTDGSTPTDVFHIQAKAPVVAALYWNDARRYRHGALPDWMPLSGSVALQGAPWDPAFGASSGYAPSTPGSVDLPLAAANFVYGWVSVGTEVVIY